MYRREIHFAERQTASTLPESSDGSFISASVTTGRDEDSKETAASPEKMQKSQWLMNQSAVLDEVDKLVDLMSVEKTALVQRISDQEKRIEEAHELKENLEKENIQLKYRTEEMEKMLLIQEQQGAKATERLTGVLEETKEQLQEAREEIEALTAAKTTCKQQGSKNLELEEKMTKFETEHRILTSNLDSQRIENAKVLHRLNNAREQYKTLYAENNSLKSMLEEVQAKFQKSEGVVLAMKGRATIAKKHEEQLKVKCLSLEKALQLANERSPTIVRVQSGERTREELRLMEEGKKKDSALADCMSKLSASKAEVKKKSLQTCKLERSLKAEQDKNKSLSQKLESMREERDTEIKRLQEKASEEKELLLRDFNVQLELQKKKEEELSLGHVEVQKALSKTEHKLKKAREEVKRLRGELENKEVWQEAQVKWEKEKEELVKHAVEAAKEEWAEECGKASEEYRRLKEVSTKRCTELAKEVWRLKSVLQELQESTTT